MLAPNAVIASAFAKVREELATSGWHKGAWSSSRAVCLLGAVAKCNFDPDLQRSVVAEIRCAIAIRWRDEFADSACIATWNDQLHRVIEDVMAVLSTGDFQSKEIEEI